MTRAKSSIFVSVIVLAITAFIVYGTFHFFGHEAPESDLAADAIEMELQEDDILRDGVYEGTALGYGGEVTTQITIKSEKITKAEVIKHNETPEYFNHALSILDSIVSANTYDVDIVAGCTVTSNAIKDGVHKAMLKARGKNTDAVLDKNKSENIKSDDAVLQKTAAVSIPQNLKDGVYYGYGMGYNGTIKVAVTIQGGRMVSIDVVSHNEDAAYYNKAYAVITAMLGGASSVDTVSGATITSRGLINAVNDALSKAGSYESISVEKPQTESVVKPDSSKEPDFDTTQKLKDGVYYAEANGYAVLVGTDKDQHLFPAEKRTPVKIKLTVKDSKIYDIEVVSHNETPEYFEAASQVIKDFLAGKERIDTVTGATITSEALKTAIKDALKQAGVQDESSTEYSDGVWYGQAYGFYSFDKWYVVESDDAWKTQTNVSVQIENGQIKDISLISFGDDESFMDTLVQHNAFNLINEEVIRTNGVQSAIDKFVVNKTNGTGQDTDAITGATFSGNGYINAIKDALARSVKYTNDKVEQNVKYVRVLPHKDNGHNMSLPYGKPFNVGNFRLKVGYTDSASGELKEEIMLLKDAMKLGIEFDKTQFPGINEELVFTPMPDDPKDYTVKKNYDLKISVPASGAKALYRGIEGSREFDTISIKELIITGPEGQEVTVPWTDRDSFKQKSNMPFRAEDVKDVKVIDENGNTARLNVREGALDDIQKNGFGVRPNQPNVLKIEIINPENPKDTPLAYYYDFKSLQLEFNIKYNENELRSIKITSKPAKMEYTVGESLDLAGLKVQLVDQNNIAGAEIPFADFEKNGIKVKNAVNGEVFESAGQRVITLEKEVKDKVITGSFTIQIKEEEERIEKTIRFYDLRSKEPVLIAEADIPEIGYVKMGIPNEYFSQGKELANPAKYNWVIADQNGKEFAPNKEMPFAFTNNIMMVYREGSDAAKMVQLFAEERVETSIRFYDIRSGEPVLIAETQIPEEGSAQMSIPEVYFNEGKELANPAKYKWVIADQNGKEFTPKNELPYGYTNNTMIVYREGADAPKMVKLSVEARTDTFVKFYDLQSGERVLIGETQIPEDGTITMAIPEEYYSLGKELINAEKFSWVIEDQNGKEFEADQRRPYLFTNNKVMIYREGIEGFVVVALEVKKPEKRMDTTVKFYDIQSGKRVLVSETQIPEDGTITMQIPEEYYSLGKELANASKFSWIIEDQNGKEFTPNKEQAYAFTGNKIMIYREGMDGFVLVKLEAKKPEKRMDTTVKFYDLQGGERVLVGETKIPEEGSITMEIPKEYFDLGKELINAEKFSWIIEDQNGKEFTPNKEQAYAFTGNKIMIYREEVEGFVLVKLEAKQPEVRMDTAVKFYDVRSGSRVLIAQAEIPAEGKAEMAIPKEYFDLGKELADSSKFSWIIEDQNGEEFTPNAEMPYAFTNNTMLIYRDGADGAKMVKLTSISTPVQRVEKTVKFYDIQSGSRVLIAQTEIPSEGKAEMAVPEEYYGLGKELANAEKFSWIIEDQNGEEFAPNSEMPYAFTNNTMLVYREGSDGAKMIRLTIAAE